jgi:acetyl esterase
MQKVLAPLASLGGKPIETFIPEEARKQPTPADAVKKALTDEGKSAAPALGMTVRDMTITRPNGDVTIHVYTPEGAGPIRVMVSSMAAAS